MTVPRRALLAALALAGCTPDPTVTGTPHSPAAPPAPVQNPTAAAATESLAALVGAIDAGRGLDGGYRDSWADAADAAVGAIVERLLAEDPVTGGDAVFERPTATAPDPADADEAARALASAADDAVATLRAASLGALDQPLRLLYASAACAAHGLRTPGAKPVAGDAEPGHFQATTEPAAVAVALSHTWALIYGLGVGLGRLDLDDDLRALGAARLTEAKQVRNALREALTDPIEQPAAFKLPTPMGTPREIRDGWGDLELGLLDGLGRLVAAGGPDVASRLDLMVSQVDAVSTFARPLPWWPGWA